MKCDASWRATWLSYHIASRQITIRWLYYSISSHLISFSEISAWALNCCPTTKHFFNEYSMERRKWTVSWALIWSIRSILQNQIPNSRQYFQTIYYAFYSNLYPTKYIPKYSMRFYFIYFFSTKICHTFFSTRYKHFELLFKLLSLWFSTLCTTWYNGIQKF